MLYDRCWWHIAAIQIGGAVCLPILIVGHELASRFGLFSALVGVGLGNALLLFLGSAAALYAVKSRKTTAETAADTFGDVGLTYFACILILSMIGWFAIQLDVMGEMAGKILGMEESKILNGVLGVGITLVGLRGIKGMELLANISLPLMVATIGYAAFRTSEGGKIAVWENEIAFGSVTLALAAAIGAVIDMPTFFRVAKSPRDALLATFLLFGLALPLLEGVGIYLASHGAGHDLVRTLTGDNPSSLWKFWVAGFIILAGWTTNNTNLYSAAVSLQSLVRFKQEGMGLVLLGLSGTALTYFGLRENLPLFLEVIGTLLASAGGVMVIHQMASAHSNRQCNVLGLVIGIAVGALSFIEITLSGFATIDALAASATLATFGVALTKIRVKKMGVYKK